jgi:hypothetical protein
MQKLQGIRESKFGKAAMVLGVAVAAWLAVGAPSYWG